MIFLQISIPHSDSAFRLTCEHEQCQLLVRPANAYIKYESSTSSHFGTKSLHTCVHFLFNWLTYLNLIQVPSREHPGTAAADGIKALQKQQLHVQDQSGRTNEQTEDR